VPKTVDHGERRTHIIDALVRVAAREGLHAVTMRAVAAESGVSLRLVQYYFETKARLMQSALDELERRSHRRWTERLTAGGPQPPTTRELLEQCLAEALPTDEASRAFHLVWVSYATLAMTDPQLAAQPFVDGPGRLEAQITEALHRARRDGELDPAIAPRLDPATEAAHLLALGHGLGTGVLVGQRTPEEAMAVLRLHLDRLFGSGS
jgi:AcrR family transcriptional regulator